MQANETLLKISESPILLAYFSQPACSVCTVLRPKIQKLAESYQIPFLYINTLEQPMASGQHMVFAVPTVILFQNGREVTRWSRSLGVEQVESAIHRLLQ